MLRWRTKLTRSQEGAMLLEAVVAILIFGIVGTAVLSGLSTAHTSGRYTSHQSTAENVARNQMEDTFNQPYQPPPYTYSSISVSPGYTVTSQAVEYVVSDPNIEKIIVTVSHSGYDNYVLETLRTK